MKPLFINIHAELSVLNEINLKLSDAAGTTVKAEFYMRLIGQFSLKVRTALIDIISKPPPKARKSSNYSNCNLQYLDEAIEQVFQSSLSQEEIEKLSNFRKLRNKLLHADFVGLMNALKIEPTGREIKRDGSRNLLDESNFLEAAKSINRNNGLNQVRMAASSVCEILERIIRDLTPS